MNQKTHSTILKAIAILILSFGFETISLIANAAVTITQQPQILELPPVVMLGNAVNITVRATGSGTLTYTWQKLGPGQTTWVDPVDDNPNGTTLIYVPIFPSDNGTQFRCKISDSTGVVVTSNPVSITVKTPPRVYAGDDQKLTSLTTVQLNPTIIDDGISTGKPMTYLWTKVFGPGNVTFADPTISNTTATFSQTGYYTLRLTAFDGLARASGQVRITLGPISPTTTGNVYYVDPEGKGGVCNDIGPGTIDHPWCDITRSADIYQTPRLGPGDTLYLRGGNHRFSAVGFSSGGNEIRKDQISGTPGAPTVISGYPGERPIIYLSDWLGNNSQVPYWEEGPNFKNDVMPTWQPYTARPGTAIYSFPWRTFAKKYHPWACGSGYSPLNNPQLVAVNGRIPILLQQVNGKYTDILQPNEIHSVRTNQNDMIAGDFYYDLTSGNLYVWLPDSSNPNTKDIEVPFNNYMAFGSQHDVVIKNLTIRFSNQNGIVLSGVNNLIDDVDVSYMSRGAAGCGTNCSIKNSVFDMIGFGAGGGSDGNLIENNLYQNGNIRGYWNHWDCGQKSGARNVTFRGNVVRNMVACPGLWFDYGQGNETVENNIFENIGGVMFEVTPAPPYQDDVTRMSIIRNNIFINSNQWLWGGGIYISSSSHITIANNLFYNTAGGVITEVSNLLNPVADRTRLKHNRVYNNIFNKVTFPLGIIVDHPNNSCSPTDTTCVDIQDNLSDNNLYYQSGSQLFWNWANEPDTSSRRNTMLFMDGIGGDITFPNWQSYSNKDTHSIPVDPLLANPDKLDFHLQVTSPAKAKGISLPIVTNDMEGNTRPAVPDLGPYQGPSTAGAIFGDVNNDGSIDVNDSLLIARYLVGFNVANFNAAAADVSGDGQVLIGDASMVAQYSVGLTSNCPRCSTQVN